MIASTGNKILFNREIDFDFGETGNYIPFLEIKEVRKKTIAIDFFFFSLLLVILEPNYLLRLINRKIMKNT